MSRDIRAKAEPWGGAHAAPFFAVLLLVLCLAGCTKTSEEPTSKVPSPPVDTAAGLPKLLDLGAGKCIPCKMMAPILEELEVDYAGVLDVEFIDVWQPENKAKAESYGVEEIPTQIFLDPDGKELWRHSGFISKADILTKWEELGYYLKPKDEAKGPHVEGNANSPSAEDNEVAAAADGPSRITVYYLYNRFRCATCKKVESLTREGVLGTQEEPGPFADEVAAGTLTFEALNIEEKEHEHFLTDFDTQAKIPVIAEMSGNRIVRYSVLDKAWFLYDDKQQYFDYMRDAIGAFSKKEGLADGDVAEHCEYITAQVAYERARKEPEQFHIVDVRTPEEHVFIGHPEGARSIPVMFMGYSYDEKMGRQTMLKNAGFVEEIRRHYSLDDHLAILGLSGPRAALAVRLLNKAGFKHLYAIIHGFQGEKQGQVGHTDYGKRRVNGWVNEGVPWTTKLVPELMYDRQQELPDR